MNEQPGSVLRERQQRVLCHKAVMMQTMSFNWFELVLWAAEERWISDCGEAE